MARNWYGQKRIIKEDKYTRKSNQYSEWEITKEKLKIIKVIEHISKKNYAQAHKYLKSVIEDKITKRINRATEKPLF